MNNSLIQDLISFSDKLHDQQKYLKRTEGMHKPNYEMEAKPAEILELLVKLLDELIVKHITYADIPDRYWNRQWHNLKYYDNARNYNRQLFYGNTKTR